MVMASRISRKCSVFPILSRRPHHRRAVIWIAMELCESQLPVTNYMLCGVRYCNPISTSHSNILMAQRRPTSRSGRTTCGTRTSGRGVRDKGSRRRRDRNAWWQGHGIDVTRLDGVPAAWGEEKPAFIIAPNAPSARMVAADRLLPGAPPPPWTGGTPLILNGANTIIGLWELSGTARASHEEFILPGGGSRVSHMDTSAQEPLNFHVSASAGTLAASGICRRGAACPQQPMCM